MNALNKSIKVCVWNGILISGMAGICWLPMVASASMETLTEDGSLSPTLTSYSDAAISVQQFNPSLGTLQSVTLELSGTGSFTQYYQNISTGSGDTITVSQTLDLTLALGDETLLSLEQVNPHSYMVSAWNGSPPFLTGTAGGTQSYPVTVSGQSQLLPADLAAFTGSGVTDLALSAMAFGSVTDANGGNFFGGSSVMAGANVAVVYDYDAIPESATWMPGIGIIVATLIVGWVDRRQKIVSPNHYN